MNALLYKFEIKGDFSTLGKTNEEFVENLQRSAHFLKGYEQMPIEEYMDGYAKRAWMLGGLVIRSWTPDIFVEDMINCGLLKKSVVQ